jgi:hypothetical protein
MGELLYFLSAGFVLLMICQHGNECKQQCSKFGLRGTKPETLRAGTASVPLTRFHQL